MQTLIPILVYVNMGIFHIAALLVAITSINCMSSDFRFGSQAVTEWSHYVDSWINTVLSQVYAIRHMRSMFHHLIQAYSKDMQMLQHDSKDVETINKVNYLHMPLGHIAKGNEVKLTEQPIVWKVFLPAQHSLHVNLTFTKFHLANSLANCWSESVTVIEMYSTGSEYSFPPYCGFKESWSINIFSTHFRVEYKVGHRDESKLGHFSARYHVYNKDDVSGRSARAVIKLTPVKDIPYHELIAFTAIQNILNPQPLIIRSHLRSHLIITTEPGFGMRAAARMVTALPDRCLVIRAFDGPDDRSRVLFDKPAKYDNDGKRGYLSALLRKGYERNRHGILYYSHTTSHLMSLYVDMEVDSFSCRVKPEDILFSFIVHYHILGGAFTEKIFTDEPSTVTFPTVREGCKVACIINFLTTPGWFLHLKITRFKSSGANLDGCVYRGLAIYPHFYAATDASKHEVNMEDFSRKSAVICKEVLINNGDGHIIEGIIPNQYSSTRNELYVLWYSYPGGRLDVEILVTRTKCRGTFIYCDPFLGSNIKSENFNEKAFKTIKGIPTSLAELPYKFYESLAAQHSCQPAKVNEKWFRSQNEPLSFNYNHGFLCLQEGSKHRTVKNSFALNAKAECVVFQHITSSQSTNSTRCLAGVFRNKGLDQNIRVQFNQLTEANIHCSGFPNMVSLTRSEMRYINFRPECSAIHIAASQRESVDVNCMHMNTSKKDMHDLTVEGFRYRHTQRLKEWSEIWFYTTGLRFIFQDKATHTMMRISHKQIPYYWSAFDTESNFPVQRPFRAMFLWNYFIAVLNHVSKFAFHLAPNSTETCNKAAFRIILIHEDCFDTETPIKGYKLPIEWQWHNITDLSVSKHTVIYDLQLYYVRTVYLQQISAEASTGKQPTCPLHMDITPDIEIGDLLRHHHTIVDKPCCSGRPPETMYYVLWTKSSGHSGRLSWTEAERFCNGINGHLPSVTDEKQLSILENLVLGTRFDTNRTVFYNPTRRHQRMHIYIGLNTKQVSASAKFEMVMITEAQYHVII